MQQHYSILEFKRGRYLKLALLFCSIAIAAYVLSEPATVGLKPYGGTWLGYTLGTIAAVLIVWLMLLGIRKRRYRSNLGSLQGWTSAHVYLGTCLIVVASLHCAFEFGWNIHTLAYVLMMAVILSGFFGVFAYLRYPALVTDNLVGETLDSMVLKLADLDQKCRRIALDLPDQINTIVMSGSRGPRGGRRKPVVGSNFLRQLRGTAVPCPTRDACNALLNYEIKNHPMQAKSYQLLLTEMTRKSALTDRVRRDLQLRALMQIWLYFHVPLSFALLAALTAHIVAVFYFW